MEQLSAVAVAVAVVDGAVEAAAGGGVAFWLVEVVVDMPLHSDLGS
jgi:hypothetical protein